MLFKLMGLAMNYRFATVMLLLIVPIGGCGKQGEMRPDEGDGIWVGQTATKGGRQGRPGSFRDTWTFEDGRLSFDDYSEFTYQSRPAWTYEIDATKEPKQIDIITDDGEVRKAIYKIEGDTLIVCEALTKGADAKRPEDFDTTKRDDVVLLTLKKKEKE